MKLRKQLFRWIGIITLLFLTLHTGRATHRALLVGIGQYPASSGWRPIHAENDIELLKAHLQPGYQIETLVNADATYKAITTALRRLANQTQLGDTVLISYSGHGQQVIALEKADEPDGLDEALIPYDAANRYSASYKGERHLIDDTLSVAVDAIRQRAGAQGFVLVLLDACHSGDSFREDTTELNYRGGYPVFGDPALVDQLPTVSKYQPKQWMIPDQSGYAAVVYVSACQSYQLNQEMTPDDTHWYGSLSYAFSEVYPTHGLRDLPTFCEALRKQVMAYHPSTRQCPEVASNLTGMQPEAAPKAEATPAQTSESLVKRISWYDGAIPLLCCILLMLLSWKKKK